MIEKSVRYDIKGRKYIDTPARYYFSDVGLRNARINFRQYEVTHLMENLIYSELRLRGMNYFFNSQSIIFKCSMPSISPVTVSVEIMNFG